MNPDSELSRFGLDDEDWLARARDAEAPMDLGALGPYRLLREVGRGGQAVVYEAVQEPAGDRVAVKRLLAGRFAEPAAWLRFEREIEAASILAHPNIVRAEGVQVPEGQLVLVMDWVDGIPVHDWARGRPRGEILEGLCKIADAVAHAHRCGIIHRDLKPANILVSSDGEPHLLDFGIAKGTGFGEIGGSSLTRTSQFLGTPAYCSPEQVSGEPGRVDTRTDVYSLGVIAYDLLVGKPPYEIGGGLRRIIETITTEEPRRPRDHVPGFDRDLEAILRKMLAKRPEQRYSSMDQVLADLERFARGDPIEAESLGHGYSLRMFVRRNRWPVAIAAAFMLMIAGFGVTMAILYQRAELEESRVTRVEAFLAAMLTPEGATSGAHAVTVDDLLGQASRRLAEEPIDDPDVEGRLHMHLARTYTAIWSWPDATRHAEAALDIYRGLGDPDGSTRSLTLLGLAEAFLENPNAIDHLTEALAIVEAREGPDSPGAAAILSSLAFANVRAARPADFDRAEELYARALAILDGVEEPTPLTAGTLYSHAVLAMEQGDDDVAVRRFRRAVDIYEALPKTLSVAGSRCREDYAKALAAVGRVEEAREWLWRSREGRTLEPTMCRAPTYVANTLARQGDPASAVPFFHESLVLTGEYLAAHRPERTRALRGYADSLEAGRFEADALLGLGRACRDVDATLLENWTDVLRGLEGAYSQTLPERATICRAVLQRFEAAEPPPEAGPPADS